MMRELIDQLDRLAHERQRLEVLISRQPGWLAWKQLSELPEPADDFGRYVHARRKAELEEELLRDPVFAAHRSIMAAVQVIESLIAQRPAIEAPADHGANRDASPAGEVDAEAVDVRDEEVVPPPALAGPAIPDLPEAQVPNDTDDTAPASQNFLPESASRDGAAIASGHEEGRRILMQTATICDTPPAREIDETALGDAEMPPDRLTRIRRIDKDLEAALIAHGVRHFAQIAAFGPADVRTLSAALNLGRRISQENWIEQAAVLAMKGHKAQDKGSALVPLPIAPPAPLLPAPSQLAPSVTRSAQSRGPATSIAEVDGEESGPLHESADGTSALCADRVYLAGDWQTSLAASIDLAAAHVEAEARARHDQSAAIDAPPQAAQFNAALYSPQMVRAAAMRIVAEVQASANDKVISPVLPVTPAVPVSPVVSVDMESQTRDHKPGIKSADPDDLELISGIDERIAARLQGEGITRFAEIAAWSTPDVAHVQSCVGAEVSISRLGWIEQAAILARGAMTVHASRRRRGEFSVLVPTPAERAVRDEAFAAWLWAHTQAIAYELVPETWEMLPSPEPSEAPVVDVANVGTHSQPIDAEFEEVFFEAEEIFKAGVSDIEGAGLDAGGPAVEPAAKLVSAFHLALAEAIPLDRALEAAARANAGAHANFGVQADVNGDTNASASANATGSRALPVQSEIRSADMSDNSIIPDIESDALMDIEAVAIKPVPAQPVAAQPVRPVNIVERITAIERDAAELAGVSRLVLERFRQDRHSPQQTLPSKASHAAGVRPAVHAGTAMAGAMFTGDGGQGADLAEAEVHIVMGKKGAMGADAAREFQLAHTGARTAHHSLDTIEHAASRERVDEASVEIGPLSDADSEPMQRPAVIDRDPAGDLGQRGAKANEIGKIRRFLKALTGD